LTHTVYKTRLHFTRKHATGHSRCCACDLDLDGIADFTGLENDVLQVVNLHGT